MKKNYNIEILRVVACVFVIVIHVANMYSRAYPSIPDSSYLFSLFMNAMTRTAVPIFLTISGLLVIRKEVNVTGTLKSILKFVIILAAWTAIYYIWNMFYWDRSYDFKDIFFVPVKKHLWYLYALIGLYLALPLIQSMMHNVSQKVEKYYVIAWGIYITSEFVLKLNGIKFGYEVPIIGCTYYLGYFIMGHLIGKYKDSIKIKSVYLILTFVAAISGMAFLTFNKALSRMDHVETYFQYRDPLFMVAVFSLFILIFVNYRKELSEGAQKVVKLISGASLGIYLIQILFIDLIRSHFQIAELHSLIGIPVVTLVVFLLSLAAVLVMKKIKFVREIV